MPCAVQGALNGFNADLKDEPMGKMSRDKGARSEREVVAAFRAAGYFQARRTVDSGAHREDPGDVGGVDGWYIEVRRRETLQLPAWQREVVERCEPDRRPIVVYRRNLEPWWVSIQLTDFLSLIAQSPAGAGEASGGEGVHERGLDVPDMLPEGQDNNDAREDEVDEKAMAWAWEQKLPDAQKMVLLSIAYGSRQPAELTGVLEKTADLEKSLQALEKKDLIFRVGGLIRLPWEPKV